MADDLVSFDSASAQRIADTVHWVEGNAKRPRSRANWPMASR